MDASDTAPGPPPAPPGNPLRRLRRSRTDRVLTGVCGGLGEATGVDPVVYRVLIFVLAFFGGAGLLVYAACWLLMPEADKETSLAGQALAKGARSRAGRSRTVVVLVLSLAALIVLGALSHNNLGALLAVLFAVAVFLLMQRQGTGELTGRHDQDEAVAGPPAYAGVPPAPPPAPAAGWDLTKPAAQVPPGPPGRVPAGPAAPAPRERSVLGRLTFGLVLLACGVLAAFHAGGADIPYGAYPALVLALSGAGLLVATRYGRARGLIALGVVALLALPAATLADLVDGDWTGRDRQIRPANVAEIAASYDFGAGRVELDLRAVDFAGADARTRVDLGAGELVVLLPPDVDVRAEVDLGIGRADILGDHDGGLGIERDRSDPGPDGPGGGTLHLTVDQGVGHVEVRR